MSAATSPAVAVAGERGAEPYYDDGRICILHGDFKEQVRFVIPGSIDVVIADPNYGETSLDWDVPSIDWLDLLLPLLKPSGSLWCFGSMRYFLANASAFRRHWNFAQEIVWEKHNGGGHHSDRFRRVHETLTHWYPKANTWEQIYKLPQFTMDATARTVRRKPQPAHWQGARGPSVYVSHDGGPRLQRSVIYVRSCHGKALHPTQKPEGIVRPVLAYSCPPGGMVLSPFMGSGTDLVVARELGMNAIGIEEHQADCRTAVARLSQTILPLGVQP